MEEKQIAYLKHEAQKAAREATLDRLIERIDTLIEMTQTEEPEERQVTP